MKATMRRGFIAFALTALLCITLTACAQNPQASNGGDASNAKPGILSGLFDSTKPVTVPVGTGLAVVLDQSISTAQNRAGDKFQASLASPVVLGEKTVLPQNARVTGHIVDAQPSGRLKGVAHLDLTLDTIEVDGKSYEITTGDDSRAGKNHNKRNGVLIGGGAGLGAVIGGIASGGVGALIGATAGAGAGTAGAAYTGKKDIRLPAETTLTFELVRPVTVLVKS